MPDYTGPHVLPTDGAIDVLDLLKPGHGPQVIDVPVRSCRRFVVMRQARPDATRPTRTADVDIESGTDAALPEPTDL
jgi:hypothetical protein